MPVETPEQPAPPTWDEVSSTPEYKSLSTFGKVSALTAWAKDTHEFISTNFPDVPQKGLETYTNNFFQQQLQAIHQSDPTAEDVPLPELIPTPDAALKMGFVPQLAQPATKEGDYWKTEQRASTPPISDELKSQLYKSEPTASFQDETIGEIRPITPAETAALLGGVSKGSSKTAGGLALAGSLEVPNAAVAAATGPVAPVTEAVLNVAEFLIGSYLTGKAVDKASDATKSIPEIQQLRKDAEQNPEMSQLGEQIPNVAMAASSVSNLTKVAADNGLKAVGQKILGGSIAGGGMEAIRPVVEQGVESTLQKLGKKPEQVQPATLDSIAESIIWGAVLSGMGGEEAKAKAEKNAPPQIKEQFPSATKEQQTETIPGTNIKASPEQIAAINNPVTTEAVATAKTPEPVVQNLEKSGLTATAQAIKETNEKPEAKAQEPAPVVEKQGQGEGAVEGNRGTQEQTQPVEAGVNSFKTSGGSEYSLDENGMTTRLKKSTGKGQGEIHDPMHAVFVTPDAAEHFSNNPQDRVVLTQKQPDGSLKQIRPEADSSIKGMDDLNVTFTNRSTGETTASFPVESVPKKGLHPFEIIYNGDVKRYHMGNKITEVKESPSGESPTPIKHKVEPPAELKPVLDSLGVRYDGIQEGYKEIPSTHQITLPDTKDTINVPLDATPEEITARVNEKRTQYEQSAKSRTAATGNPEGEPVKAEQAPKEEVTHEDTWTTATEEKPIEQQKADIKRKLERNPKASQKGFIDLSIVDDLARYGTKVYEHGMTLAKWTAHVVSEFGKGAAKFAKASFNKIVDVVKKNWNTDIAGSAMSPIGKRGRTLGGLKDKAKEITKDALTRRMSDLDRATTERGLKLQTSDQEATKAQKEIKKLVPSETKRNALAVYREAGGDKSKLAEWESKAKGKMFKEAAKAAQHLSPEEIKVGERVAKAFDILEKRGNRFNVLNNHRENYIPHVWDVQNKATGFGSARLQDRFKYNKARSFETFFDGDQAGFVPKTMDVANLLPSYMHEMNKVVADRQFVQDVQSAKSKEGEPLVIPRGRVSETVNEAGDKATLVNPKALKSAKDAAGNPIDQSKYKVLNEQPALHDWLWEHTDESGNPIFMRDDLAAHPELQERINAMMGQSGLRKYYSKEKTGLSIIPQAIAKNLDVAQSVLKREMFSFLAPFHQVQEGTHAIGHTVNPFFNIPKIDLVKDAGQQDAVKHGLMLLPEKTSPQSYIEGVGGKNSFISQVARKFGGKAGEILADVVDGYQDYLFKGYIPGLKYKTYSHIVERNMVRYEPELKSGNVTPDDVKLLSAEQTNAAYGHLNYALLDRSPNVQHTLQLALLAPDFLEARARLVAQALKPSKAGLEQLRAIAVLAAVQAAAAYTITKLSGNEYDPKHPFEVVMGGRKYYLRSVPEDLQRLFTDSRQFIRGRINPVTDKVWQLVTGLNYRGEKTDAMETVGELMASYIPITLRSLPGIRSLTETSRNSPISPLEQLASSLGIKVSRNSDITKTYELASKWMEDQGLPKDKGVYPVSKFQQLRYALEDGDLDRAKEEYQKLLKDSTPYKISQSFKESVDHPFTGSEASDRKFAASLSPEQKLIYEHAKQVRRDIIRKFYAMPKK